MEDEGRELVPPSLDQQRQDQLARLQKKKPSRIRISDQLEERPKEGPIIPSLHEAVQVAFDRNTAAQLAQREEEIQGEDGINFNGLGPAQQKIMVNVAFELMEMFPDPTDSNKIAEIFNRVKTQLPAENVEEKIVIPNPDDVYKRLRETYAPVDLKKD